MNILKKAFGLVRSIFSAPTWSSILFGSNLHATSKDSVWIMAGTEDKAQAITALPILYVDKNGNEIETMTQEQKAWAYVLENPDSMVLGRQLWEMTSWLYELDGLAYWVLFDEYNRPIQNPLEIPSRILAFGRSSISPLFDTSDPTRVIGWTLCDAGVTINLRPYQVVRFWKTNPYSYREGLSITDKVGETLKLEKGAKQTNASFFANGARPSGYLKQVERVDPIEAEKFASSFRSQYSTSSNANKMPLIPREFDFVTNDGTRDMDFVELHKNNRDEFFAATRTAKHHLGVNDNLNYATAEIVDRTYYQNVIQPIVSVFEDIVNVRLLLGTGMSIKFSFENIPAIEIERLRVEEQENKNLREKWRIAYYMWKLGYAQNDINEYLNLKAPVINAKWAKEPHDPATMPSGSQPSTDTASEKSFPVCVDFTKAIDVVLKKKSIIDYVEENDIEKMDAFCKSVESESIGNVIPLFEKAMTSYFDRLESSQIKRIEAYLDGDTYSNKANGERELNRENIESVLFSRQKWDAILLADTAGYYIKAYKQSIEVSKRELGGFINFVQSDAEAAERARKLQLKVVGINERLRDNLRDAIAQIIEAGGNRAEILEAVKSQFNASHNRTVTIARTETGIAMNTARADAIFAERPNKLWVSAKDNGVRASHRDYASLRSKPNDYEYAHGLKYPQDPDCNDAGEVVNCRCVLVAGR